MRDFRRGESTLIVGHTDYLLTAPPACLPTGTVAVCGRVPLLREEYCWDETDGTVTVAYTREIQL